MTICISLLCEDQEVALVGADRMVTDRSLPIEFESSDPKYSQYRSDQLGLVVSAAGPALAPATINHAVEQCINEIGNVREGVELVKDAYISMKQKKFEEEILEQRGIDFDEFYSSGMYNSGRGEQWDKMYSEFELGLDVMISGFDENGAHSYRVSDGSGFNGLVESFSNIGFDAVGSGSNLARDTLTSRYSGDLSVEEGLYVLYAALKNSSQAPGVGNGFDLTVIDEGGPREITETTLTTLQTLFYETEEANAYPESINDEINI
ncbi:hypothetical protein ACFO5R_07975 [Halosolutus amylolyticus]|uniref:Uncharacterized protein n=1 Tax=Halosolutus amylolyticus TaxID=2932267 RepID=A0ABD5PNH1_9EURY|nr:hypothetical protein [Halosolutus amylolyticus]